MLRAIKRFCATFWRIHQESVARRHPDKNICCKCGYDLKGIAEPPPAKSAVNVVCVECGKAVALREQWWTDGTYSMGSLLAISIVWAMGSVASMFLMFVVTDPATALRRSGTWLRPLWMVGFFAPTLSLIIIGPVVMTYLGNRGAALHAHRNWRSTIAYAPFMVVFVLLMLFGRMVFRAMGV